MRKILVPLLAMVVLGFGVALASPAQAAGSIANSCAVTETVTVVKATKVKGGAHMEFLKCGQATSNVLWATVHGRPFYVKLPGIAPVCLQAGQLFYPNNRGHERTAVLTPTVRCR